MNRNVTAGLAFACLAVGAVFIALYASGQASASRGRDWTQQIGSIEAVTPNGVTYRYEVNGDSHTATDEGAHSSRYRPGQRVVIYVNPADSAEALLEFVPRPNPWTAATGAILFFSGAAVAGYVLTQRKAVSVTSDPDDAALSAPQPQPKMTRVNAPPLSRLRPPPSIPRRAPDDEDGAADRAVTSQ